MALFPCGSANGGGGGSVQITFGVFIDTSTIIVPTTTFHTNTSYTATEDCAVVVGVPTSANAESVIKINNVKVGAIYSQSGITATFDTFFVKKGQTITIEPSYTQGDSSYTVYGLTSGTQSAASGVSYDNTDSGLSSTNVQDAIDEVCDDLSDKVDKVTGKGLSTNDYDDTAKGIVDGVTSALAGKVSTSSVGSANGVAELDANGRVPSSQLPSYVDDVLEYADLAHFPATGETGKIYIAEDTSKTYRWSGSNYAEISESLALGETSSTAYAGNKGKANADAITAIKDGAIMDSFADVEDAFAKYTFHGTQADWNALSTADKKRYKFADITDDYDDNPVGNLSALTTTDKSSCVGAINEVNGKIFNTGIADGLFCYVQPNTGNTIIGVRSIALGKSIGIQIAPDGTLSRYEEPYS